MANELRYINLIATFGRLDLKLVVCVIEVSYLAENLKQTDYYNSKGSKILAIWNCITICIYQNNFGYASEIFRTFS